MYNDRGAEALSTPELHLRVGAIEDGLKLLRDVEKMLPPVTVPATAVESPAPESTEDEVALLRRKREKQESSTKEALEKVPQIKSAQQNVVAALRIPA